MSEQKAPGGRRPGTARVPRADFVQKLVRDPRNLSNKDGMLTLSGFVGDSDEPGYTRIYFEPTLDSYADVLDEEILHYQPDSNGGPGQMLWARRDAKVKYGRRGEGKREAAGFLEGPLMQDYRPIGGGAASPEQMAQIATGPYCVSSYCSRFMCPSVEIACTPSLIFCAQIRQGAFQQVAPVAEVGPPPASWYNCPYVHFRQTQWAACYPG